MLPCTQSYVSLSVLKQMLNCYVCEKRLQNPHSYSDCEEHFFCLCCKGSGAICPVCKKSLNSSKIVKDPFISDLLKTSCFTIHDKDFEREKVPFHIVKQLSNEFSKLDKLYLEGKASNKLCTPVKKNNSDAKHIDKSSVPKLNLSLKSGEKNTLQLKLDTVFFKKTENGCTDSETESIKQVVEKKEKTVLANGVRKRKSSRGSKSDESTPNLTPENIKPIEEKVSDLDGKKLNGKQKVNGDSSLDSQSIFVTKKSLKKENKSLNERKIGNKRGAKTNLPNSERKKLKTAPADSEKRKSRQSLDLNSSKIAKPEGNPKRSSRDNCDKSILEKDKKAKSIIKKNAKGETALHVACRTNKLNQVKELLETEWKFYINEKDFAGWTPLHEAVTSGNCEITKVLLEAGAWVFVPGYHFETPLHTALYKTEELIGIVMDFGPDTEARTIKGTTPMSIAEELGLTDFVKNCPVRHKKDLPVPPVKKPTMIYCHAVEFSDHTSSVNKFDSSEVPSFKVEFNNKDLTGAMNKFEISVVRAFSKDISHIVVKTDSKNVCESSMVVLEALLMGKYILSSKWLEESVNTGVCMACEDYEVSGVGEFSENQAPYKARLNAYRLFPGLFAGAHFYLVGTWRDSAKREKAIYLINLGEGCVLRREPDPENIPSDEATIMYHSDPTSAMGKCSHILLYNEESDAPLIKYRMSHVKTLSFKWLIQCIESFSIIDPSEN